MKWILKLRWMYFHIHPHYLKFHMGGGEYHFQNLKTGNIHSQWVIKDEEDQ